METPPAEAQSAVPLGERRTARKCQGAGRWDTDFAGTLFYLRGGGRPLVAGGHFNTDYTGVQHAGRSEVHVTHGLASGRMASRGPGFTARHSSRRGPWWACTEARRSLLRFPQAEGIWFRQWRLGFSFSGWVSGAKACIPTSPEERPLMGSASWAPTWAPRALSG